MSAAECKLGDVTETLAKIMLVSRSMTVPTVTSSGGTVTVNSPTARYNSGGNIISTTLITISGLLVFTRYTYNINQDSTSLDGSFTTMPSKTDNFSFIVQSCDLPYKDYNQNPYGFIRKLMDTDIDYPLVKMFHIDDVSYVDTLRIDDSESSISSTGYPQDTGLGSDYAIGWAHYYGLMAGGGTDRGSAKTKHPDRLYVFKNLPSNNSGGDHAIAGNHCRGEVGVSGYFGCDKVLEATAKSEWDAFLGDINPPMLRAGKWHWGGEIGSVKFALFDYSLYAVPYETGVNEDGQAYSTEQISDIMTYMSDPAYDFKCFLMESPPATFGQPWWDWHPTEATGWKTQLDADDNLNGVNGNSFTLSGDNHALYNIKYDTFWHFTSGAFNGTNIVNMNMEQEGPIGKMPWGGQTQVSHHGYNINGDRLLGGFWHFKVTAGVKIEAQLYSGTGVKLSPVYTMLVGSTNNQWTVERERFG